MLGNQHTLVLPYLENLCAHDETVVRDRAVNSVTKLLDLYSDNDINNYIIPLVFLNLKRSLDSLPTRQILHVESQLPCWCAMFIREQVRINRKSGSNRLFIQQIHRYLEWGDAFTTKSNCYQNIPYVQGLLKVICFKWSYQHP
jgi:hypothetical protein